MNGVNKQRRLGLAYLRLVRDYRANPWFRKEVLAARYGCSDTYILVMLKKALSEGRIVRIIGEIELKHRIIYNYKLDHPSVPEASMVTILGYDPKLIKRAINDGITNNWEHIPELKHYYDEAIRTIQPGRSNDGSIIRSTYQCTGS